MGHSIRKNMVKSIMYISSYFPLYIFLLILIVPKMFYEDNDNCIRIMMICVMIALILISLIGLFLFLHIKPSNYCDVKNIKYADDKVMDYVCTYLMPVLSLNVEDIYSVIVNIMYFLMMWLLYVRLNLVFLNPLLAAFGYITYRHDDGYIITNIPLEKIKQSESKLKGVYLVNGVFIASYKYN